MDSSVASSILRPAGFSTSSFSKGVRASDELKVTWRQARTMINSLKAPVYTYLHSFHSR